MFTFGFYDSLNGDRRYTAEQMSAIFDGLISDGVFATIGNIFDVIPGSGLQIIVDTGKAWFNHTWNVNDSKMPLSLAAADVTLPRIDAIVLDINSDLGVRTNSIRVIQGSPSSSPVKPVLYDAEPHWQYALAYVTVPANASSISISNIEKVVGKEPTPFVTGILETVDITSLFTQWQGRFEDWFAHLKYELSGDVAGNLQRQIDEIDERLNIMGGDLALMLMTVTYDGTHPVVGVPVTGIYANADLTVAAKTNNAGLARGYVKKGNAIEFKIEGYADIATTPKVMKIDSGKTYEESWVVSKNNFLKVLATQNVMFSSNVSTVDVTVVGGGGGGANGSGRTSGGTLWVASHGAGGGGGGVNVSNNITVVSNTAYTATIGSGGSAGANGGNSSFISVTATGGMGGVANTSQSTAGSGGTPKGGTGASAGGPAGNGYQGFDSFTSNRYYGGGGGYGGGGNYSTGGSGGGGKGADESSYGAGYAGTVNTGGGGGGGNKSSQYDNAPGGKGGSGIVVIRMNLKYT